MNDGKYSFLTKERVEELDKIDFQWFVMFNTCSRSQIYDITQKQDVRDSRNESDRYERSEKQQKVKRKSDDKISSTETDHEIEEQGIKMLFVIFKLNMFISLLHLMPTMVKRNIFFLIKSWIC